MASLHLPPARLIVIGSPCSSPERRLEFLAKRHEEARDQMLCDAAQDTLTDTGHQSTDLPAPFVDQLAPVLAVRLDLKTRRAVAVTQRAGPRDLMLQARGTSLSESDISP